MNVSKTFTPQVYHHIFHCWHILNRHIMDSVFAESLKALVGLYLEGLTSSLSKVPWNKLLRKKRKIFKNLWIVILCNVITWWFSVLSQDFFGNASVSGLSFLKVNREFALFSSLWHLGHNTLDCKPATFWANPAILVICFLNLYHRKISFRIAKPGK